MKKDLLKTILVLSAVLFAFQFSNAQPGALDATFGTGGKVTLQFNSLPSYGYTTALQTNGKIVVAGGVRINNTTLQPCIARFNSNGTLDNTFGTNGQVQTPFGADMVVSIASIIIQPDGKIVGGGYYGSGVLFSLPQRNIFLIRYNTDGTLDPTFGNGGYISMNVSNGTLGDGIKSIALQSDGKIVACGVANQGNNPDYHYDFMTARFTTLGALDNTFGTGGVVISDLGSEIEFATSISVQPDKKILVAGSYTAPTLDYDYVVLRYDQTGAFDNSFGTKGRINTGFGTGPDNCNAMVLQPDGKIVLNGGATQSAVNGLGMIRITSNGVLDNSFGTGGKFFHAINGKQSFADGIILQPDGKLVSCGSVSSTVGTSYDFALTRVNNNGTIDNSFGTQGDATIDFAAADDQAYALVLQPDSKILIVGNATTATGVSYGIARVTSGLNVGVESIIAENNNFTIYPNPANQSAVINWQSEANKKCELRIFDVMGKEVFQSAAFNNLSSFDLSKLENGIYFVHLKFENKTGTQKLFVKH